MAKKIIKVDPVYYIEQAANKDELSEQVWRAIEAGYHPLGGVATVQYRDKYGDILILYSQAVEKISQTG